MSRLILRAPNGQECSFEGEIVSVDGKPPEALSAPSVDLTEVFERVKLVEAAVGWLLDQVPNPLPAPQADTTNPLPENSSNG